MLLVVGSLLAGCAGGPGDAGAGAPRASSGSPSRAAPPAAGATPSPSGAPGAARLTPDAALVPKHPAAGRALADAVVLSPGDWGRGYVAQSPAASAPGTWAVLDQGCRWEREPLPHGVLASVSRYSRLPGSGGRGEVRVTAAATVHSAALGADEQLSTTLEEVLRCPDQQPRTDERIKNLMSVGTPFGAREQDYADDSVLEIGQYVGGDGGVRPYRWMVARLGTVVVAVSVTGGEEHGEQELNQLGSEALARMLERVQQRLRGK
ncbi:hypothetical protein [Streptomyces sp. NPDC086787]|uniref:hypothetical protein n=1 Tax=Streptomyces sp. NPDC086787 TaxID=3365759 RepID=UPI0038179E0D